MNIGSLVQTAMGAVPSDLKARVTFTSTTPGTYAEDTGAFTPGETVTVTGTASRGTGDPRRYQALNLSPSEAPMLVFVPDTIGEEPDLDMTVEFGGATYKVKDVESIAPAGVTVACSVIIGI